MVQVQLSQVVVESVVGNIEWVFLVVVILDIGVEVVAGSAEYPYLMVVHTLIQMLLVLDYILIPVVFPNVVSLLAHLPVVVLEVFLVESFLVVVGLVVVVMVFQKMVTILSYFNAFYFS